MTGGMIVFSLPGHERLGARLARGLGVEVGALTVREFPDGETYVRVDTGCSDCAAVLAANLHRPNPTVVPLIFASHALREQGARRVILVAPYLAYMRQDVRFKPGEIVSARLFADLLGRTVDGIVTVDPHLHRIHALGELFSIPSRVEHAAPAIAAWIRSNVERALVVGPDQESRQWVEEVARRAGVPSVVLSKTRRGDQDVEIDAPGLDPNCASTPVLVDDIISTASTMIQTIDHLRRAHYAPPVCIGVHAVFAGDAYVRLLAAGAVRIVTANTVEHPSNAIDLTPDLVSGVRTLVDGGPPEHGASQSHRVTWRG